MPQDNDPASIPEGSQWTSPFQAVSAQHAFGAGLRRRGPSSEHRLSGESRRSSSDEGPLPDEDVLMERQRAVAGLQSAFSDPLRPAGSANSDGLRPMGLVRPSLRPLPIARRSGEVWDFTGRRSGNSARTSAEVRRLSINDGHVVSATRPRKTLEDKLIRVPSPTVDLQTNDGNNPLSVPSATTQDINDLLAISGAAVTRLSRSSAPGRGLGTLDETNTTRCQSNPHTMNLRDLTSATEGIETRERGAFGTGTAGLGWAMLMPSNADPARVVQRNLAVYAEESDNGQSWLPLFKMIPTIIGKLSVAIGADILTLGISDSRHDLIAGGSVAIAGGIVAVMLGMQALCTDMSRINPRRIPITLICSFIGMVLISTSVIVSETDIGAQRLSVRSVSAFVFGLGLTMLNTSLPLSFAYSEMVHGDTFRDYRNEAAFVLWGIGLGMATGLTVSRSAPRDDVKPVTYPFGVTHAFAVFGIACATFGTCLVATNLQRQTGRLLALRTRLRQLAAEARGERMSRSFDSHADQRV